MISTQTEAKYYIRSIRNILKRQYAEAYAAWMDTDRSQPEPQRPEGLSYMAGQAVRLNLYEYDRENA